jgi:transposase-like protein
MMCFLVWFAPGRPLFRVMGKLPACSGADRLTEVDRLKLVLDYERLQNVTEVAKKHGMGKNTVRRLATFLI